MTRSGVAPERERTNCCLNLIDKSPCFTLTRDARFARRIRPNSISVSSASSANHQTVLRSCSYCQSVQCIRQLSAASDISAHTATHLTSPQLHGTPLNTGLTNSRLAFGYLDLFNISRGRCLSTRNHHEVLHWGPTSPLPVPSNLPRAVCLHVRSQAHPGFGRALCSGNALRNWKDSVATFLDRGLPAILPRTQEAHLLLTNNV